MKNERQKYNELILVELMHQIVLYPDQRFGQILTNLGINEFSNKENPSENNYLLRDIFHDESDKIYKRIKNI